MEYNVVIICCGPAAMLHALYLKKYGIENICIINKIIIEFIKLVQAILPQKRLHFYQN